MKGFIQPDEHFFLKQEEAIRARTIELENWRLHQARKSEYSFPVQDAYWLQMEEGIRSRIKSKKLRFVLPSFGWQPAVSFGMLLLGIGISIFLFRSRSASESEMAFSQKINELEEKEILHYLTESKESMEISQQIAFQQIPENYLELPLADKIEAEDILEEGQLSADDLVQNF